MTDFRLIFEVRDETGAVIVEKSQTWVEVDPEQLAIPDPVAVMLREKFGEQPWEGPIPPPEPVRQVFQALGYVVSRFVQVKLIEWAKGLQKEKQP